MRFRAASFFYTTTLIACLLVAQNASAQPEEVPPDVLELKPDGYVYADYPGVFDDVDRVGIAGITVEAWIYLTGMPEDDNYNNPHYRGNGQWIIFAKPGSYYSAITGRNLGSGWDRLDPEGTTTIRFGVASQPTHDSASADIFPVFIPPEEYPLNRWVHVAMYIVDIRHEALGQAYYNLIYEGPGGRDEPLGRTLAPFLIGGTPTVSFKVGSQWGAAYASMQGYVDVVRVSRGNRYDALIGQEIEPRRHFQPDAQTIALWRFEEGPGAPFYRDSSRNDYTLFPGGSLAVQPHGKATTTWGNLKTRNQF